MASTLQAGWADLPMDLQGSVIALLPFPGDRARFAAVCRAWRSAVRQHASHLPWIVFPSGTFCTAGHGAACFSFRRIPGLHEDDVTCLGAAHDHWLAMDCTDDIVRRTTFHHRGYKDTGEHLIYPRGNVKHKHTYLLYNPFSNVTVHLPELDAVVGHVAETFTIRKVLMRSSAPDDIIAVTTNNCNYNIILCRPGKGTFVLPNYMIIDVVFLRDTLYGVTSGQELLAFHLGEDVDGRPNVTRIELVIKNPLSRYYYREFPWSWPEDLVDTSDEGIDQDCGHNNGGGEVSDSNENDEDSCDDIKEPNQKENDNEQHEEVEENRSDDEESDDNEEFEEVEEDRSGDEESDDNEEYEEVEEDRSDNEESDDDELVDEALEDTRNGDDLVPNNIESEEYDMAWYDEEVPYEPKDRILISRYFVKSRTEELLLVRHRYLSSPYSDNYTHNVEILKADLSKGKWTTSNGLAKGEALFLGQSYSKCMQAHGDIQEGFVYYQEHLADDAYDMTSGTTCNIVFGWPWQRRWEACDLLTWLFPPEVVV